MDSAVTHFSVLSAVEQSMGCTSQNVIVLFLKSINIFHQNGEIEAEWTRVYVIDRTP